MINITSIVEAEKVLGGYVPKVAEYTGDDMSLVRMWPLMEILGNPQDQVNVVHVAGTSGKTSTCYYIAHLLKSSGVKVGLSVSPHVDKITERLQINGKSVSDKEFCIGLSEFLTIIEKQKLDISYFELLVAFVYWYFAKIKVDYAVIETGLGGKLDASNVVTIQSKVSVITDIGIDHVHVLGDTIELIAEQKAGIIHKYNQVFMFNQSSSVMEVMEARTKEVSAKLNIINETPDKDNPYLGSYTNRLPEFQKRNWTLACRVYEYIADRDDLSSTPVSPLNVVIPGRMESVKLNNKSILLMDGAHNAQKSSVFVKSFKNLYPKEKAVIMLALKKGKEYREVIDNLHDIASSIVVTSFNTSQDMPSVSQDPKIIQQYCESLGVKSHIIDDNKEALECLVKSEERLKLVIGSFYLLSEVRRHLNLL